MLIKGLFWGSLGAIVWTHAGYPLAAAALARVRPRPVRKADTTPRSPSSSRRTTRRT